MNDGQIFWRGADGVVAAAAGAQSDMYLWDQPGCNDPAVWDDQRSAAAIRVVKEAGVDYVEAGWMGWVNGGGNHWRAYFYEVKKQGAVTFSGTLHLACAFPEGGSVKIRVENTSTPGYFRASYLCPGGSWSYVGPPGCNNPPVNNCGLMNAGFSQGFPEIETERFNNSPNLCHCGITVDPRRNLQYKAPNGAWQSSFGVTRCRVDNMDSIGTPNPGANGSLNAYAPSVATSYDVVQAPNGRDC